MSTLTLHRMQRAALLGIFALGSSAFGDSVYIALGDSITFGETDLRYIPSLGDRGYVGVVADRINGTNGSAPRPQVINLAIDGETADSFLDGTGRTPPVVGRTDIPLASQNLNYQGAPETPQANLFSTRVAEQVLAGNSIDIISITLGFNELAALSVLPVDQAHAQLPGTLSTYQANYTQVLTLVRNLAPSANLYLLGYFNPFPADPTMNTADAVFGQGGPQLNAIIQMLAGQFQGTYVDTFTPYLGREAELTYIDEFPAGSTVPEPHPFGPGTAPIGNAHPNAAGYSVIADQILSTSGSSPSEVPEPASVSLCGLGAAMIGLQIWRRRKA